MASKYITVMMAICAAQVSKRRIEKWLSSLGTYSIQSNILIINFFHCMFITITEIILLKKSILHCNFFLNF